MILCDLDIGRQQLLGAALLTDIILPHGTQDGLHIVRGVCRVIGQPGRVPPQRGLGDNTYYESGRMVTFTSLSLSGLRMLHRGDKFRLVASQALRNQLKIKHFIFSL